MNKTQLSSLFFAMFTVLCVGCFLISAVLVTYQHYFQGEIPFEIALWLLGASVVFCGIAVQLAKGVPSWDSCKLCKSGLCEKEKG